MPKGLRPSLEPPSHRKIEREVRRPCFCLTVTITLGLLIFFTFLVIAWNVYDHKFAKNTHRYHWGDEVSVDSISNDLDSLFCGGYKVSTLEISTVLLLPHRAWVNTSSTTQTTINVREMPMKRDSVSAFYLLEGSRIDVFACRENGSMSEPSKMLLLKGEYSYPRYRDHIPCKGCLITEVKIPLDAMCNQDGGPVTLSAMLNVTDTYYLVVSYGRDREPPPHHHPPGIIVNGTLTRTHYDLRDAEMACVITNQKECLFDIPWNTEKDVVVQFQSLLGKEDVKTTLMTHCQIRLPFWIFVFGAPPLVIFVLTSLPFGWVFCKKRKRNLSARPGRRHHRRREDRTDLVHNEIVPQNAEDTVTIQG